MAAGTVGTERTETERGGREKNFLVSSPPISGPRSLTQVAAKHHSQTMRAMLQQKHYLVFL